jgi:hypothetical protein
LIYSAIKLREEECDKSKDVERRGGGREREGAETEQHYLSQKKKKEHLYL